jgi:molecular chaperone GrpE (heat shock protein)
MAGGTESEVSAEINREQILRRFEQWLDDALASEEPPGGIDGEILSALAADSEGTGELDRSCDSYALWAAMTALTQEVKLQGRAFKELNDTLGSQASRIGEEMRAAYRERERELQREVERRCRREILSALVDLRDRLGRGLESVREGALEIAKAADATWLQRLIAKPGKDPAAGMLSALRKGYELGVERLDQTLDEFNAREIRCEGQRFDPRRMNAIDRQESDAVPDGTVLEVYRSGYDWNGEVFRPALVKVSTTPAAGKEK